MLHTRTFLFIQKDRQLISVEREFLTNIGNLLVRRTNETNPAAFRDDVLQNRESALVYGGVYLDHGLLVIHRGHEYNNDS